MQQPFSNPIRRGGVPSPRHSDNPHPREAPGHRPPRWRKSVTRKRREGAIAQLLSLPGVAELAATHVWNSPRDEATFRQSLRNLAAMKGSPAE